MKNKFLKKNLKQYVIELKLIYKLKNFCYLFITKLIAVNNNINYHSYHKIYTIIYNNMSLIKPFYHDGFTNINLKLKKITYLQIQ